MSLFGEYFKHLRENVVKKTLEQICEESRLSLSWMSKIERGVIIPTRDQVCHLQLSVSDIYNKDHLTTLMELSKVNDKKTYNSLSKSEKAKYRMRAYMGAITDGNPITWEEADEIVKGDWTE